MLLTLVVVAISAWRVSVMNVSTAIRNLPEPPTGRRRRRLVRWPDRDPARPPFTAVRARARVPRRPSCSASRSVCSASSRYCRSRACRSASLHGVRRRARRDAAASLEPLGRRLGTLAMDFSTWIVAGLMIIVGAGSRVVIYNAAALLRARRAGLRPHRGAAPVLRMSIAYPRPRGSAPERRSQCSPWSCSRS